MKARFAIISHRPPLFDIERVKFEMPNHVLACRIEECAVTMVPSTGAYCRPNRFSNEEKIPSIPIQKAKLESEKFSSGDFCFPNVGSVECNQLDGRRFEAVCAHTKGVQQIQKHRPTHWFFDDGISAAILKILDVFGQHITSYPNDYDVTAKIT